MATPVILVDGVGSGVVYQRGDDQVDIIVLRSGRVFERIRNEFYDGKEVYRLLGVKPRPRIRHINAKLSKDDRDDAG